MRVRRRTLRWVLGLGLAILLAVVVIWLLLWYGPDVIARHDVGNVSGSLRIFRLQQARDAARGRLLTLGAGLFAAGALIFTAQNYRVAQQTLEVAQQGQVTDRFTKAIEQLGSDKLDIRVGGAYALGRVAYDSVKDERIVLEVLCAFVREHSREPWPLPEPSNPNPERMTRPDVQAAIAMIGQPSFEYNLDGAGLRGANLSSADLRVLYFEEFSFREANLTRADLTGAKLGGADFEGANLTEANLSEADLTGAILHRANLRGATLSDANLTGADLSEANLTGTHGSNINLSNVDLRGAITTPGSSDGVIPAGWARDPVSGRLRAV